MKLITPVTKEEFNTIMGYIVESANRIEEEKNGKISYEESLALCNVALDSHVGLKEYIIKTTGTRHCADWLTSQF